MAVLQQAGFNHRHIREISYIAHCFPPAGPSRLDLVRIGGQMRRIELAKPVLISKVTDMFDRILQCWCEENGYPRGSVEAGRKAKSLLQWIELGVTDEAELSDLIHNDIVINSR
jgi:hypothetical protein